MINQTKMTGKISRLFVLMTILTMAGIAAKAQKTFAETLKVHIDAIRQSDLKTLEPTVADSIVHISPTGELNKSKAKFMKVHEDWFKTTNWEWEGKVIESTSNASLGNALIRYTYIQKDNAGKVVFQISSYLILIFKKIKGSWQLIHDQNTAFKD